MPRRRQWHPTPVLLPGKSYGRRSLVGCSPGGREESDMTEWLHFHFSLSCIGEANGNPLQCSCLENPRDRGAWWAAISGVSQSWTQMKGLSSSSKSSSSRQENEWGGYRFVIGQSCWWEGEGNIPFKKWYFKNYLTTIVCWASLATRMEDWVSQGRHKRKPEIPVVTRESRRNSRKTKIGRASCRERV